MGLFPRSLASLVTVLFFDEIQMNDWGPLALLLEELVNKAFRASLLISSPGGYHGGPATMGVVVIKNNLLLLLSPSM